MPKGLAERKDAIAGVGSPQNSAKMQMGSQNFPRTTLRGWRKNFRVATWPISRPRGPDPAATCVWSPSATAQFAPDPG
jgi:hypothetical protein